MPFHNNSISNSVTPTKKPQSTLVQRLRLMWCTVSSNQSYTWRPPQCIYVTGSETKRVPEPSMNTYLRVFAVRRPQKLWTRLRRCNSVFFPMWQWHPWDPQALFTSVITSCLHINSVFCPWKHFWIWGSFPPDFVAFLRYKIWKIWLQTFLNVCTECS